MCRVILGKLFFWVTRELGRFVGFFGFFDFWFLLVCVVFKFIEGKDVVSFFVVFLVGVGGRWFMFWFDFSNC